MIRYIGKMWNVEKLGDAYLLKLAGDASGASRTALAVAPHEAHVGRRLLVKPGEVWECAREGEPKPVEMFDCNPTLFERVAKHVAAEVKQ